jgi:hypothetical protein
MADQTHDSGSPGDETVEGQSFRLPPPARLHLTLSCAKTRTNLRDGLALVEVDDEAAVLEVPREACSQGDVVALELRTEGLKVEIAVKITAKVAMQRFETLSSERGTVALRFETYDEKAWRQLCAIFSGRQADVMRVLEAMKG